MDASMEENQQSSIKFIRKLRKKLRQIERLEKTQRELTEEERIKLSCKHDLRDKLQSLLSTLNDSEISRDSNETGSVPPVDAEEDEVEDYEDEDDNDDMSADEVVACEKTEMNDAHHTAIEKTDTIHNTEVTRAILISEDAKKKSQSLNIKSALRRSWRKTRCHIMELKGHNDYVSCTDASEEWIVSGSRDTTVKLWSCLSGKELKNMGGHTGQVTAVRIIDEACSNDLRSKMDLSTVEVFTDITQVNSKNERIVLSGSTDCSVRLWIIPSGLFVKSIYNYNPVSSLEYFRSRKYVLVGSSSGNLTVYDLCSSNQIYSSVVHSNLITAIKVHNERIITSSADGSIKVWNIESTKEDDNSLCNKTKFNVSSEDFDLRIEYSFDMHDAYTPHRYIHSFVCFGSEICFGDDGCNIKFWDPSSGEYTKLRNHKSGVPGMTDGISIESDVLLCTSYDMDRGNGSINLRSLREECNKEYIASFYDENTPRLATLTTIFSEKLKYMVTGGEKLLAWQLLNSESSSTFEDSVQDSVISGKKVAELARPVVHSDASSDEETSTDDETKWFWQKSKQPETGIKDDDESSTTDSEKPLDELPKIKPPRSICNWCTVL